METIVASASDNDSDRRKIIAIGYLRMTRQERDKATRNTFRYAKLGNAYGLTHQTIGELLGIPEAHVRQLVYGD